MKEYLKLARTVLEEGVELPDRTGVGTINMFSYHMKYDLRKGFPLVTTKNTYFKAIKSELLWFLEGSTDERRLAEIHYGKCRTELTGKDTVWTPNALAQGKELYPDAPLGVNELGPVYGKQWMSWTASEWVAVSHDDHGPLKREVVHSVNQIENVIKLIKESKHSRRVIVSAWNVGELDKMAIPPCHVMYQFFVMPWTAVDTFEYVRHSGNMEMVYDLVDQINREGLTRENNFTEVLDRLDALSRNKLHPDINKYDDYEAFCKKWNIKTEGKLNLFYFQRSADIFLGVPFNIASYALLLEMMAKELGMMAGELSNTIGCAHIYSNHIEQMEIQVEREPLPLARIKIADKPMNVLEMEDIELIDYTSHEKLTGKMAV